MPVIKRTKVEFEGRIEEREVIVEEEHVGRAGQHLGQEDPQLEPTGERG